MRTFTTNLEREVDKKIRKIMDANVTIIKKSFEASSVLAEAFNKLRDFITNYSFQSVDEEIDFFKNIKPRIFHKLLYFRKVYNIEMNRPLGIDAQRAYLIDEMNAISRYNEKRSDFIRYYRSNLTSQDELYYLRGRTDLTLYLESSYYERDPMFSTNCDFKLARVMAHEKLIEYITEELKFLDIKQSNELSPYVRLTWNGSKTELTELIFALHSKQSFGNIPLTQLYNYIQMVFNIELDKNFSRTFSDMRIRNSQTPFLDKLKSALLHKMSSENKHHK